MINSPNVVHVYMIGGEQYAIIPDGIDEFACQECLDSTMEVMNDNSKMMKLAVAGASIMKSSITSIIIGEPDRNRLLPGEIALLPDAQTGEPISIRLGLRNWNYIVLYTKEYGIIDNTDRSDYQDMVTRHPVIQRNIDKVFNACGIKKGAENE